MIYEVELKFPLDDPAALRHRLDELGAEPQPPVEQRDCYLAHPQRDFAETDEALRIRRVGDWQCVTYKGPLVDRQSKTRHEIEVPFGDGPDDAGRMVELFGRLGFREVRSVEKTRVPYHLTWEGHDLELALDDVRGLGEFLEIEGQSDDAGREAMRDAILRLADRLGLSGQERRSYLQLLLERESV